MVLNYNPKDLETLVYDFYNATGINLNILDANFNMLKYEIFNHNSYCGLVQQSSKGDVACNKSDQVLLKKCKESRSMQIHVCHAGLIDIAIPIIYDSSIIGYIILGQIKGDMDFEKIKDYVKDLSVDYTKLEEYYNILPVFDEDKIKSISAIAVMLTKYILFENLLKPTQTQSITSAINYINENLNKDITVSDIAREVHLSKSYLYKVFHNNFNCTISEYVNRKRIEQASALLIETNLSVEEIANKVGFVNIAYFSRLFKKTKGSSPLKFRKNYGLQSHI